ncbi:AraC family transcriptional regulator [Aquirhabdus parva]|uniref:AraC family transcriptional regulator n=1 Tax=Aquirhabdus parva TaxID=2283318 RepID=A0A345P9U9_9GAMM|nr:AraC family transcriptional regulator [Aquirhabdus parva]AXI04058.1 AraC family transcriptional regulator [Aquirhabdus parva]
MQHSTLIQLVEEIAQSDGDYCTSIPMLMVYRRSAASDPIPCIYGLGLGITLQGRKRVTLGDEIFDYGPEQSMVTSIDLPVASYVTQANAREPYLGMRLELDAAIIAQVASVMNFLPPLKASAVRAMSVVSMDQGLLDALTRLVRLLDEPYLVPSLAPLIEQEIVVQLLSGEHGPTLRHLVTAGAPSQQIAKVIAWLKLHFTTHITMDDLAAKAYMSPSTFRQHFRAVTGMSPLQYVKHLRLQDARQLMLNEDVDASSAAIRVGYESASQFSREYTRLFGEPPLRDIKRVRESSSSAF